MYSLRYKSTDYSRASNVDNSDIELNYMFFFLKKSPENE